MKEVDIIWTITRICPWDCSICCVNALLVRRDRKGVVIADIELGDSTTLPMASESSPYEQALRFLQREGRELTLEKKLRVLDHLQGFRVKIDFSGGDPFVVEENIFVLEEAARRFGRENITVTATGASLQHWDPHRLASSIGELNFSFDRPLRGQNPHRPRAYAPFNLAKAKEFEQLGVPTRAECPLSVYNVQPDVIRAIYEDLHAAGISTLLLMRLFPVGRGASAVQDVPTRDQCLAAIETVRNLESRLKRPKVRLQCALRWLELSRNPQPGENPCDLVRKSFGLMADGTLLASPWAVDRFGRPLGDVWVLGNLAETPLSQILNTDRVRSYLNRLNENFGHCKVFAYLHSTREDPGERLFDRADPLYI